MAKSSRERYCAYCGQTGERYYSPETAALIMEVPVETVRYWIKERRIGSVKFGRKRRIPTHEISSMAEHFPALEEALN